MRMKKRDRGGTPEKPMRKQNAAEMRGLKAGENAKR